MEKCSVVVPCFNEQESLPIFYEAMENVIKDMKELEFEYLFVDDGSTDSTIDILRALSEKDDKVHYLSFSRNFGKEAAMYAGLSNAVGDYVVIMDADLQDPPAILPEMYGYIEQGYDSVATRRVDRKGEPPIRSFFARRFYGLMRKISKTEIVDGARDYRLMTRQVTDAILSMKEYNRFSKGIFGWVGYETKWIEYENVQRAAGETKWSFWKLLKYSIEGIASFSEAPLFLSSILGVCMCGIAFFAIIFIIVRQLLFGGSAFGWPSMACIVILIGGLQLLCIGILGLYFSKAYLEVKQRPIYIAREVQVEEEGNGEKNEKDSGDRM